MIFGYTLIKKSELERLRKSDQRLYTMGILTYWFSGWTHVYDLLHSFATGKINHVNIDGVREEFAKKMGTDRWGNTINKDEEWFNDPKN